MAATVEVKSLTGGGQSLVVQFATESFGVTGSDLGGQLGGLAGYEDKVLVPLAQSVTDMAGEISKNFNDTLTAGYAMGSAAATPESGKPLFVFNASSTSGMLQVTAGLTPQDLGFSADPALQGDSANLLQLIDLKNQPIADRHRWAAC